jgi:hypothetical protein
MQKRRSVAILLAMLMVMVPAMMAGPSTAAAAPAPAAGTLTTAIMQVIPNVGTFTGALTVTSFQLINGVVNAVGTISGTLTNAAGTVLGTIANQGITIPLSGFTGTCSILTLNTGAINLSVLGLNVSLSPINLVITATAAPGNLLGNLLCAVVHLLDSNGALSGLTNLLNQILGAL